MAAKLPKIAVLFWVLFLALSACSKGPKPILYGQDGCDYCRMVIVDQRYGGELVTQKGKVFKFDSVECLAAHYTQKLGDGVDFHSIWIVDYAVPKQLGEGTEAVFLRSPALRSPMGMNLTAFLSPQEARESAGRHPGDLLDWSGVLALVRTEWDLTHAE